MGNTNNVHTSLDLNAIEFQVHASITKRTQALNDVCQKGLELSSDSTRGGFPSRVDIFQISFAICKPH